MIKLPNNQWTQPNNSDKFGSLAYSKNINLDELGYIKLSPRMVTIMAEEASYGNADFGIPLAIGRMSSGAYMVATSNNANFNGTISATENTWTENSGSNEPTLTIVSHAVWFKGLWHATSDTGVFHRPATGGASQAWTSASISLTSGKRHYMAVMRSSNSLCISNGNTVVLYTESGGTYTLAATLTLPADYEVVGLAYNDERLGITTRLGDSSNSQNEDAYFFIWDGSGTSANASFSIGSDLAVSIVAYKSSFVIITRAGLLLYWNGGGFDTLATFPFYVQNKIWGGLLDNLTLGNSMVVDGDVIYIHVDLKLNPFNRKAEIITPENHSGAWCYDPKVGLYHRWSPSLSKVYVVSAVDANVNLTTNVIENSSGTIAATGSIVRFTSATTVIGGLSLNTDYYVIKLSSTTFSLATTRENAIAGTAIDLTSKGSGGTNYFWMYELVDYSTTFYSTGATGADATQAGAIALVGETGQIFQDILLGGDYGTTALVPNDALCLTIPYLENRGYTVTSKIFSKEITDTNQKLGVKFRPLKSSDSIVVKYKVKDVLGLPITSSGDEANWTSPSEFYTAQDLSEAKTYLDAGGDLECEITSGAGGGVMSQVVSIATDGTTYSVVLEDTVLGASSGLKAEFIITNWKVAQTITSADEDYVVITTGDQGKFIQYKLEMRGSDITIEELQHINTVNQQSQ